MMALKEMYMEKWQIMATKGEEGEETASVLLPLPRRLEWSGNSTITGLLWIGQEHAVARLAIGMHRYTINNVLPTSSDHIRENDYQKARMVYVIRGFSTSPGLDVSQRSIIGRMGACETGGGDDSPHP